MLAGALVASAVVGYALVRITSPGGGNPGDATASTSATTTPLAQSDRSQEPTDTLPISGPIETASGSQPTNSTESAPTELSSDTPDSGSTEPVVPSTASSALPESDVVLPAAWSGMAKVTVAVLGECASSNPSVYSDIPADLALDLVRNEANAAEVGLPADATGDEVTLTLGVNPNGVPSVAVYSSQIDATGVFQRYWQLSLTPAGSRTDIHGVLINQPSDGSSPNIIVDAETSQRTCESAGVVSLPRALAAGATIDGWVSPEKAALSLHATTTDGKRTVDIELTATNTQ